MPKPKKTETATAPQSADAGATKKVQRKQKQRPDVTATQPEADATIPTTSQPDAPAATGASRAARKPAGARRRDSSGAQPRPEASALAETPRKTARKATPNRTAADPAAPTPSVTAPAGKAAPTGRKSAPRKATAQQTADPVAADLPAEAAPAETPVKRGRGKRAAPQATTPEAPAPEAPTPEVMSADVPAPQEPAAQEASTPAKAKGRRTPARRGATLLTEPAPAEPALAEPAPTEPAVAEQLTPDASAKPRRGRKPRAETAAPEVAGPEVTVPESAAPEATVPEMTAPEVTVPDDQPVVDAPAPRRGRGRRAATTDVPAAASGAVATEAPAEAPAVVEVPAAAKVPVPTEVPAPAEVTAPVEAVAPARRGRKPRANVAPAAAADVDAAALSPIPEPVQLNPVQPDPVPLDPAADPVILEVPKKRGGRGRRAPLAADQALPDVLSGVEAIPAQADAGAAQPTGAEPVSTPEKPARRGRKPRTQAAAEAVDAQAQPPVTGETDDRERAELDAEGQDTGVQDDGQDSDDNSLLEANPARDIVVAQLRKLGRPVHVKDLERTFTRQTIRRLGNWRDLTDLLESLVEQGQVIRTRKKTYGLPEAMSLIRGRFQASAAGFGFVIPDSGGDDYYVPAEQTMEAWNGDIVLVRMEGRGDGGRGGGPRRGQKGDGNPRASVVRIVQRAYKQLVGTLEFHHGHPILKPDDHRARHRILVLPDGLGELEAGARVVTELFWPENTGEDEVFGQVTRVLGAEDDPVTETEAVIVKFGLRGEFPPEVEEQANAIPTQIPEEALVGRLDLREFNIFTVDGRDAKDFDDAIHIQPTPEGTFVVGIHIADVSHYVTEGTPLDEEAYARATSVYLPGRVLPMLPEHLSNGVCSLVPYEDRLTMTAMVELSAEGEILKVQIAPSVINSKARLTYDEVQAYSEATAPLPEQARQLEGDLHLLLKITTKLRQKRLREGSLDFKLREVKVDVGTDGRMELIPIREETARGMIEDLMLLANKVVAHELLQREIPALFRIHEEPTLQRFQDVTNAIGRLGFSFPGGEPTPQAYQAVLKQVRGTPRESVVNTLLLRSMQQAKYAGENLGHFGLAFDEYLHFTSPIRRYPDLLVHRVLKGMLSGELKAGNREVAKLQGRLPAMGDHTSDRERTASEAERDLTKYYQAKWAQEHLGESFTGNVSGVVASGLFVALDNGVEGKLHISNLDDDYYAFIEDAQMLRGRSRGRSYRLGDPVHVTINTVNPLARQTDFTLADPTSPDYRPGDIHQETDM
ncbi:ribonuclease R, partial [Deinococcus sp.]|uniref:ribonuclease R n=1 Tax=Deinococcus sp. TaxID=47478 RepID=UPI00391DC1A0